MSDFVNTVDVIGDDALSDQIIQKTITELKDNVLTKVKDYGLIDCTSLAVVELPNVTHIGSYALNGAAIAEANFPSLTTCGGDALRGCKNLQSANLPELTAVSERMFYSGPPLGGGINAPKVTRIGGSAFAGCKQLMEVDFPLVTTLGNTAFSGCTALKEVNLPLVTSIPTECFRSCAALTEAGIDLSKITSIGTFAFQNTAFKKVDLPVITSIGNFAFRNCASLEAVILRSETMVTNGGTFSFAETPIATGTGYIYVPRALVDTYKADSVWSTYAAQIRAIEDYPDVCG